MRFVILCLCILASPLAPLAAQPWRKPVKKWSDGDAKRVLTDSPWAKRTAPKRYEASATPDTGAARGPFPSLKLIVRWESGIPVMHAHRRIGSTPVSGEGDLCYVIAIAGLRIDEREAMSVLAAAEASLRYRDGDLVRATGVRVLRDIDGSPLLVFQFPKAEGIREPGVFRYPFGITFRPNEFHFAARIGPMEIKQKFTLRDMLYLRRLAL